MFICLFVCLFVYLFICLFVHELFKSRKQSTYEVLTIYLSSNQIVRESLHRDLRVCGPVLLAIVRQFDNLLLPVIDLQNLARRFPPKML